MINCSFLFFFVLSLFTFGTKPWCGKITPPSLQPFEWLIRSWGWVVVDVFTETTTNQQRAMIVGDENGGTAYVTMV